MRSLSSCTSVVKDVAAIGFILIGWATLTIQAQEPPSSLSGFDIPAQTIPLQQAAPPTADSLAALRATDAAAMHPGAPSANQTRVVLLKNDRCLTGRVRQLGDQVIIEIDNSARIAKPASEVLAIADNLEGIYRYKVGRYPRLGPGENIRLMRWTMANGLLQQASQHFLALEREVGSEEPVVKQLGIELREQLLKDEAIRAYVGLPRLSEMETKEPVVDEVRTASSSNAEPLQPVLPAVLSSYTDNVQPILLKRCSQSGCHGLSSTNKLKFVQPIGNSRARMSEQNCRSVLQFVNVDSSNMSTLVRYALVAHGLQKTAAITPQESRLVETLQSWTTFARNPIMAAVDQSPATSPSSPSSSGAVPAAGATAPAVYNGQPKSSAAENLKPVAPGSAKLRTVPQSGQPTIIPGTGPITNRELDELDDQVRKALGEPPRSQSTDPFDPAEFNRQRKK